MTEEEKSRPSEGSYEPTTEAWNEVGRQFQSLGESLAAAFRTAWEDEGNRQQLREMRDGLQSMVNEVGQAIDEAASSTEGQKARAEAERAAASARAAAEKSWQEARPHLVAALDRVSAELQQINERLKRKPAEGETPSETESSQL
ncbi:MAG: hypothetical protein ACP5GX_04615 [Anaerolineae bacterium]